MKRQSGNKVPNFIIFIVAAVLLFGLLRRTVPEEEVSPTQFKEYIEKKEINNIKYSGEKISGELKGPQNKSANKSKAEVAKVFTLPATPEESEKIRELAEQNKIIYRRMSDKSWVTVMLVNIFWVVLFLAAWWFLVIRPVSKGGKAAFSFGQSKAELHKKKKGDITFKDVAGCEEAKEELQEIVEFLKNPAKFRKLGGRVPKGVLLMGPPGNGKTLLAKAVAGEAQVPFFSGSGSEFVEMFVGVGAARVRDLFAKAKKAKPAVIFLDELDAVGRHRFSGIGGGHDEREQTLNQLLVELDGFSSNEGIILIAATNRPDVLDSALLRPGRFDRKVPIPLPMLDEREAILQVHAAKVKLDSDADLKIIARRTPMFTGADLANVINEAALLAARRNKETVKQSELEEAVERAMAGPKRKKSILSGEEKKTVAYHECGHTLVVKLLENSDPVHKVTIMSHGQALGFTLQLPEEDKKLTSKEDALNKIKTLLGGRVAESILFNGNENKVTSGASDDLNKATQLAWDMVAKWGMGKSLTVITDNHGPRNRLLQGEEWSHLSQQRLDEIDNEVREIIAAAKVEVTELLNREKAKLNALAEKLLEKGELNSEEINEIYESA